MSLFCWTQSKNMQRIFWRMWETEQFWGTIDFHSIFSFLQWKSMVPQNSLLQTFFKISSFVFGRTNKFIEVCNYLRVSKWWQNFHFWVNYPFNKSVLYFLYICQMYNIGFDIVISVVVHVWLICCHLFAVFNSKILEYLWLECVSVCSLKLSLMSSEE